MSPKEIARIRDSVINDIVVAFEGVSRANGVSLHEAQVIDGYGTEAEKEKARKLDTEIRWQDVPDKDIEGHNSILCFVDLIGWRYYLPAYMVWVLRQYLDSDSFSIDSTIYSLEIPKKNELRQHSIDRFVTLSLNQARAVCRFLRFVVDFGVGDEEAAQRALDQYWKQFSEATS